MHLIFATRGMKWHRDRFVEQLANMYMPMTLKDEKGNEKTAVVQPLLQPIELWSFVFPEENIDKVLNTLDLKDTVGTDCKDKPMNRTLALKALRKALGLKKIPKWDKESSKFPLYRDNMQIIGIGVKEDYKNELGNECL